MKRNTFLKTCALGLTGLSALSVPTLSVMPHPRKLTDMGMSLERLSKALTAHYNALTRLRVKQ